MWSIRTQKKTIILWRQSSWIWRWAYSRGSRWHFSRKYWGTWWGRVWYRWDWSWQKWQLAVISVTVNRRLLRGNDQCWNRLNWFDDWLTQVRPTPKATWNWATCSSCTFRAAWLDGLIQWETSTPSHAIRYGVSFLLRSSTVWWMDRRLAPLRPIRYKMAGRAVGYFRWNGMKWNVI